MATSVQALVSIIMPSYNHALYIGQAIQSVIDQSYQNWELIVIDNYSDDDTDVLLKSYSDKRISVLKIHNEGVIAKSRNAGIRSSKGDFIAFLDSDDWWYPNKLERQISFMLANPLVGVTGTRMLTYPGNRKIPFGLNRKQPLTINKLLSSNIVCNSSAIVSRKAIDTAGYLSEDPEIKGAEDYAFWLRVLAEGFSGIVLNDVLGRYRMHSTQVSSSGSVFLNYTKVVKIIMAYCGLPGFYGAFKNQYNLFEIQYLNSKYSRLSFDFLFESASIKNKTRTVLRAIILEILGRK